MLRCSSQEHMDGPNSFCKRNFRLKAKVNTYYIWVIFTGKKYLNFIGHVTQPFCEWASTRSLNGGWPVKGAEPDPLVRGWTRRWHLWTTGLIVPIKRDRTRCPSTTRSITEIELNWSGQQISANLSWEAYQKKKRCTCYDTTNQCDMKSKDMSSRELYTLWFKIHQISNGCWWFVCFLRSLDREKKFNSLFCGGAYIAVFTD